MLPGALLLARARRELLHRPMDTLKLVFRTIIQMAKQACALPQTIVSAVKQSRQRSVLNEHEAERLDRIRNPSKYRGK